MPDLTQYLPFDKLQPFFDNARPDDSITEAWREQRQRNLRKIVHPELTAFFKALKAEGRMHIIPNSEGYATRLWNAWNSVSKLTASDCNIEDGVRQLESLASRFAHRLIFDIVYPYERVLRDEGPEAAAAFDKNLAYVEVTSKFSKGDYEPYDFSHESCWNTDLPLCLGFKDWVPYGCYITDTGFVAIPPLDPPHVHVTKFELKTGNLLVADWFRISEFTKIVEKKDISINSRKGREEKATHLARKFNLVSICVGNTCPGVYQNGNQIVVGYHNDDEGDIPDNFTEIGSVCTDLWAATFVEYETLIELVARKKPDTAKEIVDAYLTEHEDSGAYGLHKLTVEPGTYYLYHFGDYEDFAEMAQKEGLKLDTGHISPYFLFTREPLPETQEQ